MTRGGQNMKDNSACPTYEHRRRGGHGTHRMSAARRAVASGEVDALEKAGKTHHEIAQHFCVPVSKLRAELTKKSARKAAKMDVNALVPGREYGKMIFERVVHGAARMYLFHHVCGWRETFTELQWKERGT